MPKCYGYIRVSSLHQANFGQGMDAQKALVQARFEAEYKPAGFEWGGWFEDPAVSAGKVALLKREGGLALNNALERGDVALFSKLDRGFRDTRDCLNTIDIWEARGIIVNIIDIGLDMRTPMGRLFLTIGAAFATFERARISERCKESKAIRRAQGLPLRGAHYGFKLIGPVGNRRLEPDPKARKVGQFVVQQFMAGYKHSQILARLLMDGIKHPSGIEWCWYRVRRIYVQELKLIGKEAASLGLELKTPQEILTYLREHPIEDTGKRTKSAGVLQITGPK